MKAFVWLLVLVALGGAAWWFLRPGDDASQTTFRTGKVERGEVVEGVAASGTVQPVELIQVGTQVSGVVQQIFVDFNSKVTAGQTVALLDARRLQQSVTQTEASLARANADVARSKATIEQNRADVQRIAASRLQAEADIARIQALLVQAEKELERKSQLVARNLTSQSELDAAAATKGSLDAQLASARAALPHNDAQQAAAEATVRGSQAQLEVSEAVVKQVEAQLESDRVNLGYATIVSPVDGVVVSRSVDVGQTVAASLQAPVLFTIARDLTKVQVQTSVPEAHVGRVHEGQVARFTVDAHPDEVFEGKVTQIRLAATTVQNVVTYTVIVDASNPKSLLLPGMTANVKFEVARSEPDQLRVPATALRLQVPPDLLETPPAAAAKPGAGERPPGGEEGPRRGTGAAAGGGGRGNRGGTNGGGNSGGARGGSHGRAAAVYVQTAGGMLRAIPVKTGVSDGVWTAVLPEDPRSLAEGTEVVTAVIRQDAPQTTNPFAAPSPFGGGRRPSR